MRSDHTARSATKCQSSWLIGQRHAAYPDRSALEKGRQPGPRMGSGSPGGVVVPLDGVMLGGGPYTYYTGSYSFKDSWGMSAFHKADIPPSAGQWSEHTRLFKPKASNYFASVLVVLRLYGTAPVSGITHIAEYKDREGRHALPLFLAKRIVEWLPSLGE